jgi:hypothetical protein
MQKRPRLIDKGAGCQDLMVAVILYAIDQDGPFGKIVAGNGDNREVKPTGFGKGTKARFRDNSTT